MQSTEEIIEKLGKLEIFSDISSDEDENTRILTKVCNVLNKELFTSGQMIIREGDVGNSLYILLEGEVQIIRNTINGEPFAVVNLFAEQNVFFGEVAIIDKDTRSASVKAITDCKTLVLTYDDFKKLCDEEPMLGYKSIYRIAVRLASALRSSTKDVLTLYQALLDEVGAPPQS